MLSLVHSRRHDIFGVLLSLRGPAEIVSFYSLEVDAERWPYEESGCGDPDADRECGSHHVRFLRVFVGWLGDAEGCGTSCM